MPLPFFVEPPLVRQSKPRLVKGRIVLICWVRREDRELCKEYQALARDQWPDMEVGIIYVLYPSTVEKLPVINGFKLGDENLPASNAYIVVDRYEAYYIATAVRPLAIKPVNVQRYQIGSRYIDLFWPEEKDEEQRLLYDIVQSLNKLALRLAMEQSGLGLDVPESLADYVKNRRDLVIKDVKRILEENLVGEEKKDYLKRIRYVLDKIINWTPQRPIFPRQVYVSESEKKKLQQLIDDLSQIIDSMP